MASFFFGENLMVIKFLISTFIISFSILAKPTASVEKVRGEVFYNGNLLSQGSEIVKNGVLKTNAKSFVKIFIKEWGNTITLGPRTTMKIDLGENIKVENYSLINGAARWIRNSDSKVKDKGAIYTKVASLGVRGTDFYIKNSSLFGETEIIVFNGKVSFQSKAMASDEKLITKGQWGGLGGRFGAQVKVIPELPNQILDYFNSLLIL